MKKTIPLMRMRTKCSRGICRTKGTIDGEEIDIEMPERLMMPAKASKKKSRR